jgi:hypothetical protein
MAVDSETGIQYKDQALVLVVLVVVGMVVRLVQPDWVVLEIHQTQAHLKEIMVGTVT